MMMKRLSDLIREGCEMSEPGRHCYVFPHSDGTLQACAWGAATLPLSGGAIDNRKWADGKNRLLHALAGVEIADDHVPSSWFNKLHRIYRKRLFTIITKVNDGGIASRQAIAEWVDYLIDEHGYELYIEVPTPLQENASDAEDTDAGHPSAVADEEQEPAPALHQ